MDLRFDIDYGTGLQQVTPPRNWKGIGVQLAFTAQQALPFLSIGALEWVEENAVKLNAYKANCLVGNNGKSLYEGLPAQISACVPNMPLLKGIIPLAARDSSFECDMVKATIMEKGRIDWLNDIAPSVDFFYLASLTGNTPGRINPATDYKLTPYTIASLPNYTQAALLGISVFVTAKEIAEVTRMIAALIAELTGDATTATVQLGTSAATVIATIAIIVLYIAYLFVLILLLVNLIKNLIAQIVQKKKYKLCMREETIFQRACAFLGLQFSSTIYGPNSPDKDATHMPPKTQIWDAANNPLNPFTRPADEGDNFPFNNAVSGHPGDTFREYMIEKMAKYNAEFVIKNGTLYFEEKHYWQTQSTYVLPNTGAPGFTFNLPDPHKTNAAELPSQYFLAFARDDNELNTVHRYRGTTVQASVYPSTVGDKKNLTFGTPVQVRLNEALAKRKEMLTEVETLLDAIINPVFNFINGITSAINGLVNAINWAIGLFGGSGATIGQIPALPTNIFGARIGWMEVSNDTFGIAKTFIGTQVGADWEIAPQSEAVMSAIGLFNRYHGKNLATRGNQQLIYEDKLVKFCCEDFVKVLNSNIFTTPDGFVGQLESLEWEIHNDQARVNYRIFRKFDNHLTEKIIIDGIQ